MIFYKDYKEATPKMLIINLIIKNSCLPTYTILSTKKERNMYYFIINTAGK